MVTERQGGHDRNRIEIDVIGRSVADGDRMDTSTQIREDHRLGVQDSNVVIIYYLAATIDTNFHRPAVGGQRAI